MSPTSTAEDFVKASKLKESQLQQLLSSHEKAIRTLRLGGAGWHKSNEIGTLEGLEGEYLWIEDPRDLLASPIMSLKFAPNGAGYFGSYKLTKAGNLAEEGDLFCRPNNTLTGWAMISLIPTTGVNPRAFVVDGMMTDAEGRIIMMVLKKWVDPAPSSQFFCPVRIK